MLLLASCTSAPPVSSGEVAVAIRATLPIDPSDAAWRVAPVFTAALLPQDQVEPRLLEPSTAAVRVQGFSDGTRLALRLAWDDATRDELTAPARFADACAMQLPRTTEANVPAPQMGEPGRPVDITYWRASWQGWVNGRADTIQSLHPGAVSDHYPFNAAPLVLGSPEQQAMEKRYSPARALGAGREGPRSHAEEDLEAEGPGSLHGAIAVSSESSGSRTETGWQVVLIRPLPAGLGPGGRSQVAFAVWDGARQEVGARKMRSVWVPLALGAGR
jgi:DMSO reductase family type II enzyme heme b subunit